MFRLIVILVLLSSPLFAQGVSLGVHGCGSWLKGEISSGGESFESDETESIYGFGADISIRPTLSPLAIEAGFTYLSKSDTDEASDTEATIKGHPAYVNAKFYLSPMLYVAGGVNYTFWSVEADGVTFDDLKSKLGFQGGVGAEFGAGNIKIYGSAMYFVQKGEIDEIPDIGITFPETVEFEAKGFQIRAGVRMGM